MKTKSTQNTLASFKSVHDPSTRYVEKIKLGIASLASEGPEVWENEGKFIRRCGMASHQFADLRGQFKDYWVEVPRRRGSQVQRAWFGDKRVAAKARV